MKKNIAILAGGNSSEFPVSIRSAEQIAGELDPDKYDVYKIIIKGTTWMLEDEKTGQITVNKDDFSCNTPTGKLKFDCALITIHGTPGEDGKLQGYFESLNIPYTTSGILSSSLTFNKKATKLFLESYSILSQQRQLSISWDFRFSLNPIKAALVLELQKQTVKTHSKKQ